MDRLPIAMSVAARAMDTNVQGLTKMLEAGELIATEFLPKFGKELSLAARNGGALTAALNTSGVAMQRFGTTLQLGIFDAFEAGAGEGLASTFNDLSEVMKNLSPLFKTVGRVVGKTLSSLTLAFRALFQVIRPVFIILDKVTGAFSDAGNSAGEAGKKVSGFARLLTPLKRALEIMAGVALLPFALIELGLDRIESITKGEGFFDGFFDGFIKRVPEVFTLFTKINSIVGTTIKLFMQLRQVVTGFVTTQFDNLTSILSGLSNPLPGIGSSIQEFIGGGSGSQSTVDKSNKTVVFNVDASGFTPEGVQKIFEDALQNEFSTSMEVVQ